MATFSFPVFCRFELRKRPANKTSTNPNVAPRRTQLEPSSTDSKTHCKTLVCRILCRSGLLVCLRWRSRGWSTGLGSRRG
ncbi:hypothetical protein A4A49_20120 [Nicotiana attenuata]|uniref:Uncharacterized protein n=1 Tax=Nicotiana attenuata TaxID=49451 RepID=A0A1J6IF81_NICAT|nr:hypothetical protein A4A49_20120 [Nicotiana attenuata]